MKVNPTRALVAQLAAQLMYDHGIRDFSLAKRKAARQLGIVDAHHLPGNLEIEAAIRDHQALFHADTHPELLRQLRQTALETMQLLANFDPHLTGGALSGSASQYDDIQIELFTDNEKEVEMYLLNHNIPFRQAQSQASSPHGNRVIPCFVLQSANNDIRVTVQPHTANRNSGRIGGETLKRASISQLTHLLAQATAAPPTAEL